MISEAEKNKEEEKLENLNEVTKKGVYEINEEERKKKRKIIAEDDGVFYSEEPHQKLND